MSSNPTFDESHKRVKQWVETNKRLPSRAAKNDEEQKNGAWCNKIRISKRCSKLSQAQIDKCATISGWYWTPADKFDIDFAKLTVWVDSNDKLPTTTTEDAAEKQLGWFCYEVKRNHFNKCLSDNQSKKCEAIKNWKWFDKDVVTDANAIAAVKKSNATTPIISSTPSNKSDVLYFRDLKLWFEKTGVAPNKSSTDEYERRLADTLSFVELNRDMLTAQQQQLIDNIYKLNVPQKIKTTKSVTFDEDFYDELLEWTTKYRRIPNITSISNIEKRLAEWCMLQLQHYDNDELSDIAIAMFHKIPGWKW